MRTTILLALLLCASCHESDDEPRISKIVDGYDIPSSGVSIITIRGCDYAVIVTGGGYGSGICHAGDCTNPIHTPAP